MTRLQWVDVADIRQGDLLVSIVGFSRAKHPALSKLAERAGRARGIVLSNEPAAHGARRIVFAVGSTTMARTWIPATILAVDTAPMFEVVQVCNNCGVIDTTNPSGICDSCATTKEV